MSEPRFYPLLADSRSRALSIRLSIRIEHCLPSTSLPPSFRLPKYQFPFLLLPYPWTTSPGIPKAESCPQNPKTWNPNIRSVSRAAAESEATGLVNAAVPPVPLLGFHYTATHPFHQCFSYWLHIRIPWRALKE